MARMLGDKRRVPRKERRKRAWRRAAKRAAQRAGKNAGTCACICKRDRSCDQSLGLWVFGPRVVTLQFDLLCPLSDQWAQCLPVWLRRAQNLLHVQITTSLAG